MNRRGFFGILAGVVVAPAAAKALPSALTARSAIIGNSAHVVVQLDGREIGRLMAESMIRHQAQVFTAAAGTPFPNLGEPVRSDWTRVQ